MDSEENSKKSEKFNLNLINLIKMKVKKQKQQIVRVDYSRTSYRSSNIVYVHFCEAFDVFLTRNNNVQEVTAGN